MVSNPAYGGTFDGSFSPVVEICEWTGTECVLPLLAQFTTTTGPGSETVRVVPEDERYIVNWHTDEFGLDDTKTYRIVAQVDGQELGHADVDVVSSGKDLKNVDTGEFIPLKDGRTLPIKFRIEEGLVLDDEGPVTSDVVADPNPVKVGDPVTLTATVDDAATGGSTIASAEYNVDGGTYSAMAAADGTFDAVSEAVDATIPAFAAAADYTVCVRGTDALGNTGAETCITVTVKEILWATVTTGFEIACAVTTTGEGYCWGGQAFGDGGTGIENRFNNFIQPITGGHTWVTIDAGNLNTCALAADGVGWCFGENERGLLGTTVALPLPGVFCFNRACVYDPLIVEGGLTFSELHHTGGVSCGLTTTGKPYCWGTNVIQGSQMIGAGGATSPTPIPVNGGLTFTTMAVGAAPCGLTAPGDPLGNVWCWGENKWGVVGNGTSDNRFFEPVRGGGGLTFTSIDAGGNQTCALTEAGEAYCWGLNKSGQLGIGDPTLPTICFLPTGTVCARTPVAVTGGHTFTQINSSEELQEGHVCAITTAADAYCWGKNFLGQVGDGTTIDRAAPTLVIGGHKFIDIATGGAQTCGVTTERELYCWGNNSRGQLGAGLLPGDPDTNLGDTNPHPEPVKVLDPA